jgi:hypothetical protein
MNNWSVSERFAPLATVQGIVGGVFPQLRTLDGENGLLADLQGWPAAGCGDTPFRHPSRVSDFKSESVY